MPVPQIDPQTGERIPTPGVIQIDPRTGERIDLSAGLVPNTKPPIDISAGLVPNTPPPIDYTALAKSMGAISSTPASANGAPIDYTALAKSMGAIDSQPAPQGFWSSLGDQNGILQTVKTLGHAIAHPIDTAMGIAQTVNPNNIGNDAADNNPILKGIADQLTSTGNHVKQAYQAAKSGSGAGVVSHLVSAVPFVGPGLDKAMDQAADNGMGTPGNSYAQDLGKLVTSPAAMGTLTGLASNVITPKASLGASADALEGTGDALQSAGVKSLNRTVGAIKSDFKRGAIPSRGYFAEGQGPALSMQSLADKGYAARDAVTDKLDAAYKGADQTGDLIPVSVVANAVGQPMKTAYKVATGPGAPKGLLDDLTHHASTFQGVMQDGIEQGGFTPSQVWDLKKSLADATNWSDAPQIGIKKVSQQQVGALSGVLQQAVPQVAGLNQSYMDLTKFAGRAAERAATGSIPLSTMARAASRAVPALIAGGAHGGLTEGLAAAAMPIAFESIPVRTTAASALYYTGKGLSRVGNKLGSVFGESAPETGDEFKANSPGTTNGQNAQPNSSSNNYVPQLPPPTASNGTPSTSLVPTTLKGQAAWQQLGLAKLTDHINRTPNSEINLGDVTTLQSTPKGKDLLMQASDLTPGSAGMKSLVRQISTSLVRTKESQK